jgi:hypothetical protein
MAEGEWDGNSEALFSELHALLRDGDYEGWQKKLKEVFSAQLIQYEKHSNNLCEVLKGECYTQFKPMSYLELGGRFADSERTSDGLRLIVSKVVPHIREEDLTFLERDVLNQGQKIVNHPPELNDMWEKLHKNNDVAEMVYEYFLEPKLQQYERTVREYLGKVDELNKAAERILNFSKLRMSWLKSRSTLTKNLISRLGVQYKAVQQSYEELFGFCHGEDGNFLSFPRRIHQLSVGNKVPLFVDFMDSLREYDPKPGEIRVTSKAENTYLLSMQSSNAYEMVEPKLYLQVGYADDFSDENENTIDLTEKREGYIFKNKVLNNDGKSLEVALEVKLPQDGSFILTSLDVHGDYELPYLQERIFLEPVKLAETIAVLIKNK